MSKQVVDPWLEDDGFSRVDFGMKREDLIDPDASEDPVIDQPNPQMQPELIVDPAVIPQDPDPEGPEVFEIDGVGTVTRRKTSKGWEVEVKNLSGGQPQIFKGANKDEVMVNLAKAQLNATSKIRQQNRELRTVKTVPPAPQATPAPAFAPKELTADDIVDIKLKLETNPALAMSEWFQKATGLSLNQLAKIAQDASEGKQAKLELLTEQVGNAFLASNPDYFPTPQNFEKLIKYLAQYKLGRSHVKDSEATQVMGELAANGFYTVENLEEAFEELSQDGSLQTRPVAPPPPQAANPDPAAPNEGRIVHREVRPRAAYGLPKTANAPAPAPQANKAPTVEDFESMTDEQIQAAMNAVRRYSNANRRN